jgi:hypothetical protein
MSQIATTPVVNGAVTSAVTTNTLYAGIATATASLDGFNTQTEWVSQAHVDTTANDAVFNTDTADFCNADLTYTLTSESYVSLNLGGTTPVRISYAPNLLWGRTGELLRVHADINVDGVGNITLPAILSSQQDCFYLALFYQDNAGTWHQFSTCDWGFSLTNYTTFDVTNVAFVPPYGAVPHDYSTELQTYALTHPRHRFRCSVTGFLPQIVGGVKAVELRAKLDTVATVSSVRFKEATMAAIMVRN